MIIVTGTKRSGTSMWMQILASAGLPHIGEPFPSHWPRQLAAANPGGYFESALTAGVYFATNPHPDSGVYLSAAQSRGHAVKIFVPGLVRTDIAYIDRVVATVRAWREQADSLTRMRRLLGGPELDDDVVLPPPLQWWRENFALLRDVATRRYACHIVSLASVIEHPERTIRQVFAWLGRPAPQRIADIVRTPSRGLERGSSDLDPDLALVFDELYDHIHRGAELSPSFVRELNRTNDRLRAVFVEYEARRHARLLERRELGVVTPSSTKGDRHVA